MSQLLDFHFIYPFWLLALIPTGILFFLLRRQQSARSQWRKLIAPHLLPYLIDKAEPVRSWALPKWSNWRGASERVRPYRLLVMGLVIATIALAGFNRFDRGRFQGTRMESITYVVEQSGRYQFPEKQIVWWNTQTQSLETEVIPAIMVSILPSLKQILLRLAVFLASLAGLILLAWYYRKPLQNQWIAYFQRQAESEKAYFRRLRQACLSNNPQTAFNQLMQWLDQIARESGPATLDELLIKVNDAELSAQIAELEQQLFSQFTSINRDWSGERFYQAIARLRKRWLRQHQSQHIQIYELQPLNPVRDIENVTRT